MSRPLDGRWCDADGTHISLFNQVEQVTESTDHAVLLSRMHHRGKAVSGAVVSQGLNHCVVCFEDEALVSLPRQLLDLLPDAVGGR